MALNRLFSSFQGEALFFSSIERPFPQPSVVWKLTCNRFAFILIENRTNIKTTYQYVDHDLDYTFSDAELFDQFSSIMYYMYDIHGCRNNLFTVARQTSWKKVLKIVQFLRVICGIYFVAEI